MESVVQFHVQGRRGGNGVKKNIIDSVGKPVLEKDLIAYREGIKRGVWWFARWKDGKQVVGVMEYPLEDVYKQIDGGEYD